MLEQKNNYKAWIYLSPALVLLLVFTFYPIVNTFILVFYKDYQLVPQAVYRGWTLTGNFRRVFENPDFVRAIYNTMLITFISVPASVILSLFIAVWLNSIKKLQGFFQTVFFLPYVTNSIAIGMTFAFIFHHEFGLVNRLIGFIRINPINWVGPSASYGTAMFTLLVFIIWNGLAFKILVFLSGLQGIDKQYYDAAKIDSASRARIFRRITVPLLSPMIAFITITSFIGAFKEYTAVIGMFGERMAPPGTERDMMITIVGVVYNSLDRMHVPGGLSLAAATAVVLFMMTLAMTLVNMYISKKKVHY